MSLSPEQSYPILEQRDAFDYDSDSRRMAAAKKKKAEEIEQMRQNSMRTLEEKRNVRNCYARAARLSEKMTPEEKLQAAVKNVINTNNQVSTTEQAYKVVASLDTNQINKHARQYLRENVDLSVVARKKKSNTPNKAYSSSSGSEREPDQWNPRKKQRQMTGNGHPRKDAVTGVVHSSASRRVLRSRLRNRGHVGTPQFRGRMPPPAIRFPGGIAFPATFSEQPLPATFSEQPLPAVDESDKIDDDAQEWLRPESFPDLSATFRAQIEKTEPNALKESASAPADVPLKADPPPLERFAPDDGDNTPNGVSLSKILPVDGPKPFNLELVKPPSDNPPQVDAIMVDFDDLTDEEKANMRTVKIRVTFASSPEKTDANTPLNAPAESQKITKQEQTQDEKTEEIEENPDYKAHAHIFDNPNTIVQDTAKSPTKKEGGRDEDVEEGEVLRDQPDNISLPDKEIKNIGRKITSLMYGGKKLESIARDSDLDVGILAGIMGHAGPTETKNQVLKLSHSNYEKIKNWMNSPSQPTLKITKPDPGASPMSF